MDYPMPLDEISDEPLVLFLTSLMSVLSSSGNVMVRTPPSPLPVSGSSRPADSHSSHLSSHGSPSGGPPSRFIIESPTSAMDSLEGNDDGMHAVDVRPPKSLLRAVHLFLLRVTCFGVDGNGEARSLFSDDVIPTITPSSIADVSNDDTDVRLRRIPSFAFFFEYASSTVNPALEVLQNLEIRYRSVTHSLVSYLVYCVRNEKTGDVQCRFTAAGSLLKKLVGRLDDTSGFHLLQNEFVEPLRLLFGVVKQRMVYPHTKLARKYIRYLGHLRDARGSAEAEVRGFQAAIESQSPEPSPVKTFLEVALRRSERDLADLQSALESRQGQMHLLKLSDMFSIDESFEQRLDVAISVALTKDSEEAVQDVLKSDDFRAQFDRLRAVERLLDRGYSEVRLRKMISFRARDAEAVLAAIRVIIAHSEFDRTETLLELFVKMRHRRTVSLPSIDEEDVRFVCAEALVHSCQPQQLTRVEWYRLATQKGFEEKTAVTVFDWFCESNYLWHSSSVVKESWFHEFDGEMEMDFESVIRPSPLGSEFTSTNKFERELELLDDFDPALFSDLPSIPILTRCSNSEKVLLFLSLGHDARASEAVWFRLKKKLNDYVIIAMVGCSGIGKTFAFRSFFGPMQSFRVLSEAFRVGRPQTVLVRCPLMLTGEMFGAVRDIVNSMGSLDTLPPSSERRLPEVTSAEGLFFYDVIMLMATVGDFAILTKMVKDRCYCYISALCSCLLSVANQCDVLFKSGMEDRMNFESVEGFNNYVRNSFCFLHDWMLRAPHGIGGDSVALFYRHYVATVLHGQDAQEELVRVGTQLVEKIEEFYSHSDLNLHPKCVLHVLIDEFQALALSQAAFGRDGTMSFGALLMSFLEELSTIEVEVNGGLRSLFGCSVVHGTTLSVKHPESNSSALGMMRDPSNLTLLHFSEMFETLKNLFEGVNWGLFCPDSPNADELRALHHICDQRQILWVDVVRELFSLITEKSAPAAFFHRPEILIQALQSALRRESETISARWRRKIRGLPFLQSTIIESCCRLLILGTSWVGLSHVGGMFHSFRFRLSNDAEKEPIHSVDDFFSMACLCRFLMRVDATLVHDTLLTRLQSRGLFQTYRPSVKNGSRLALLKKAVALANSLRSTNHDAYVVLNQPLDVLSLVVSLFDSLSKYSYDLVFVPKDVFCGLVFTRDREDNTVKETSRLLETDEAEERGDSPVIRDRELEDEEAEGEREVAEEAEELEGEVELVGGSQIGDGEDGGLMGEEEGEGEVSTHVEASLSHPHDGMTALSRLRLEEKRLGPIVKAVLPFADFQYVSVDSLGGFTSALQSGLLPPVAKHRTLLLALYSSPVNETLYNSWFDSMIESGMDVLRIDNVEFDVLRFRIILQSAVIARGLDSVLYESVVVHVMGHSLVGDDFAGQDLASASAPFSSLHSQIVCDILRPCRICFVVETCRVGASGLRPLSDFVSKDGRLCQLLESLISLYEDTLLSFVQCAEFPSGNSSDSACSIQCLSLSDLAARAGRLQLQNRLLVEHLYTALPGMIINLELNNDSCETVFMSVFSRYVRSRRGVLPVVDLKRKRFIPAITRYADDYFDDQTASSATHEMCCRFLARLVEWYSADSKNSVDLTRMKKSLFVEFGSDTVIPDFKAGVSVSIGDTSTPDLVVLKVDCGLKWFLRELKFAREKYLRSLLPLHPGAE